MHKFKEDLVKLVTIVIICIILFKIFFNKEEILVVIKIVLAFFWIFCLPGFAILYYWQDSLNFLERFSIGIALSIAIISIPSYYLGLLGLHLRYHGVLLPLIWILIGIIKLIRKKLD